MSLAEYAEKTCIFTKYPGFLKYAHFFCAKNLFSNTFEKSM